ncbi:hypothetical protein BREVNS_1235 [Brevinematales bacterium NS]|nr:hypothetical protein BREVNS_1235 [Brevinematales bacterium NS]
MLTLYYSQLWRKMQGGGGVFGKVSGEEFRLSPCFSKHDEKQQA